MSLVEDHGGVHLEMLLPGVDHIETQLEPRALTVRGRRQLGDVTREVPGKFEHRTFFGHAVDPEAATIEFVDGVLTVRIPASRYAHS